MIRWFVAAGGLLVIAGCQKPPAPKPVPMTVEEHGLIRVPEGSPLRSRLTVAPVSTGTGVSQVTAPAQVEADPRLVTNILAPLTGRVTRLDIRLGQAVRAGQVLAELDSGDLAQARSDLAKARDAYELAAKQSRRASGVESAGGAAVKDVETAKSVETQAKAELDRAAQRLAALNGRAGGGRLVLTAPRTGVVTALNTSAGAQVNDPTQVLMTISDIDHVEVAASLAEDQIGRVRLGAPARISLSGSPGAPLAGRVTEIDPLLATDTRRQKVRVALANPGGRLLPGMYATVAFSAPAAGNAGVTTPQSALLMNNDTLTVMVEVRPWTFQRRVVKIADETDTTARVVSGLQGGERIVVRGGVLLND